ncbi:hypothetical protein SCHPADRAFT_885646 [Schizopora paradoxa]|uniref:Zn(2)-C6 fungal-type domain-containing protein n=1 Tax=Schizopora paradoxa TaxID=27342 RepID=A0A0H2SQ90_9AGAM|nr:hypothetical protein SCHPADRAFT_885646 [Schizopora paradoxa]
MAYFSSSFAVSSPIPATGPVGQVQCFDIFQLAGRTQSPVDSPNASLEEATSGDADVAGHHKRNFRRNMEPCGSCSARKIRCIPIQDPDRPRLCVACKRRGLQECEPHVPWKIARERFGLASATPRPHLRQARRKKSRKAIANRSPGTSLVQFAQDSRVHRGEQQATHESRLRQQIVEESAIGVTAWTFGSVPDSFDPGFALDTSSIFSQQAARSASKKVRNKQRMLNIQRTSKWETFFTPKD